MTSHMLRVHAGHDHVHVQQVLQTGHDYAHVQRALPDIVCLPIMTTLRAAAASPQCCKPQNPCSTHVVCQTVCSMLSSPHAPCGPCPMQLLTHICMSCAGLF